MKFELNVRVNLNNLINSLKSAQVAIAILNLLFRKTPLKTKFLHNNTIIRSNNLQRVSNPL